MHIANKNKGKEQYPTEHHENGQRKGRDHRILAPLLFPRPESVLSGSVSPLYLPLTVCRASALCLCELLGP